VAHSRHSPARRSLWTIYTPLKSTTVFIPCFRMALFVCLSAWHSSKKLPPRCTRQGPSSTAPPRPFPRARRGTSRRTWPGKQIIRTHRRRPCRVNFRCCGGLGRNPQEFHRGSFPCAPRVANPAWQVRITNEHPLLAHQSSLRYAVHLRRLATKKSLVDQWRAQRQREVAGALAAREAMPQVTARAPQNTAGGFGRCSHVH